MGVISIKFFLVIKQHYFRVFHISNRKKLNPDIDHLKLFTFIKKKVNYAVPGFKNKHSVLNYLSLVIDINIT